MGKGVTSGGPLKNIPGLLQFGIMAKSLTLSLHFAYVCA